MRFGNPFMKMNFLLGLRSPFTLFVKYRMWFGNMQMSQGLCLVFVLLVMKDIVLNKNQSIR
ncbi:hypothetical protein M2101_001746 [Parabacteroides sp. PM5-20]|nr:hypothetical protein [Parabacteroides sp. PM5-20]